MFLKGQWHKNVNCEKICSCFWPKQFTGNWFLHCCPILRHSSIILWGRNLFLSPERIRHDLPYFFKLALCRTRDFLGYRQFFVNFSVVFACLQAVFCLANKTYFICIYKYFSLMDDRKNVQSVPSQLVYSMPKATPDVIKNAIFSPWHCPFNLMINVMLMDSVLYPCLVW